MDTDGKAMAHFLTQAKRVTILTGAGVSTASGIPGYRDRNGEWMHAKPMQYADFVGSEDARKRYWARSFAGWSRFSDARPNDAHTALATLETRGIVDTLITQNVDGLHGHAGSARVIDLHGRLDTVRCLGCDDRLDRGAWQQRLDEHNIQWRAKTVAIKPDGDVDLEGHTIRQFRVPACSACNGVMKPDVVFFGESVPKQRVLDASEAIERSGGLLIVGSSLMVFSGFRFARLAVENQKPVAIINQGRTRADALAQLKVSGDCSDVLGETLRTLDLHRIGRSRRSAGQPH